MPTLPTYLLNPIQNMHSMYGHLYLDNLYHHKGIDIVSGYNCKINQWLGTGYTGKVYQIHLTDKRHADLGMKNMKCSILSTDSCCVCYSLSLWSLCMH